MEESQCDVCNLGSTALVARSLPGNKKLSNNICRERWVSRNGAVVITLEPIKLA